MMDDNLDPLHPTEASPSPILVLTEDGHVEMMNRAAATLFGFPNYQGPERRTDARAEIPVAWFAGELDAFVQGTSPELDLEREIATPGGLHTYRIRLSRVTGVAGAADRVVVVFSENSAGPADDLQIAPSLPEGSALALVDDTTGLFNRRGFFVLSGHLLRLADQVKKHLAVVVCTIESEDTNGGDRGLRSSDQALVTTGEILRESFRASDIIARVGRVEFATLVVGSFQNAGETLASRIQRVADTRRASGEYHHQLSVTVGLIPYDPLYPRSADELLARIPGSV